MKGSDSDILQSNVDGLSASGGAAPNQSSVSRAARLLFTAPTCGVCVYDPVYACACYGCCCSAASLACASVERAAAADGIELEKFSFCENDHLDVLPAASVLTYAVLPDDTYRQRITGATSLPQSLALTDPSYLSSSSERSRTSSHLSSCLMLCSAF